MKKNIKVNTTAERIYIIERIPTQFINSLSFSMMMILCLIAGSSAIAEPDSKNDQSLRSIAVDYDGKSPRQKLSKYAIGKNDAQQSAFDAASQIDTEQQVRKTREQVIAERKLEEGYKTQSVSGALDTANGLANSVKFEAAREYLEFDIYSAHSRLFDDNDYDGFYQTFSVSFDADVYGIYAGQRALVFADLYLSRNGGPWELYFTTEPFTIFDDTNEDEFEVLTTLDLGFSTQHYDVLIDLYEVGYSDIVATVSGEQLDSLYALPLESADRDIYVVETVTTSVSIGAGSFSMLMILMLLLVIAGRVFNNSQTHNVVRHRSQSIKKPPNSK